MVVNLRSLCCIRSFIGGFFPVQHVHPCGYGASFLVDLHTNILVLRTFTADAPIEVTVDDRQYDVIEVIEISDRN